MAKKEVNEADKEAKRNEKSVKKNEKLAKKHENKKPTDKLADKTALTKFLQGVFGDAQKKTLKRLWKRAQEITRLEPKYEKMSDEELKAQTEKFRAKIDKALKTARAEQDVAKPSKIKARIERCQPFQPLPMSKPPPHGGLHATKKPRIASSVPRHQF